MRSSTNDYAQLASFANYTYSPKQPSSTYQKGTGLALGFNSPKNESQKGISLSSKLQAEASKYTSKTEKPAIASTRKSAKSSQESIPDKMTSSATFNKSGTYGNQSYKISDQRGGSTDKRDAITLNTPTGSSKPAYGYQSSTTKYGNVSEVLRSELGYAPKPKKLVIDTNLDSSKNQTYDNRSYSTKNQPDQEENLSSKIAKKNNNLNKYSFEPFKLSSTYTPPSRQANQIQFNSKIQTEIDDDRNMRNVPASTKNRQSTLDNRSSGSGSVYGMIVSNRGISREKKEGSVDEKPNALNSRKIGFSSNGQLKYNNLNQGVIKSNNFFSSSGNNWSSVLNNKEKSTSSTMSNSVVAQKIGKKQEDLTRSATFERKSAAKQQDLRSSLKIEVDTPDTAATTATPKRATKDHYSVERTVQTTTNAQEKEKPVKSGLDGLITKVNRGDILGAPQKPTVPAETKPSRPHSKNAHSIDEKAAPSKPPSRNEGSRSVKHSDSKAIGKSQQTPQEQEFTRPSSKMGKSGVMSVVKSEPREQRDKESGKPEKKPFIYFVTSLEKHHREYDPSNYFCQIYREHFMQTFQALMFCRYLKPIDPKVLNSRKVNLPRKEFYKDKKTLIFDLDETLIHCNESTAAPCDFIVPIRFPHGEVIEAGINVRPYAIDILRELSPYYEIVVFTASQSVYANVVIDKLDPKGEYVQHRLYREHCTPTEEGVYVKDLRIIGNRNIQDMILIDNAAYSFGYQIENGIPIIPFYDNKTDQELKHLIPYLKFLSTAKDPREINKLTFKMHQYAQYNTPDQILQNVVFQD